MKRRTVAATAAVATTALALPTVAMLRPDIDAAARDARPVVLGTPAKPVAWVQGSTEGTRLGLLSLRRSGPRVVTAKLRLTADRQAPADHSGAVDLDFLADDYADDVSGARLVDEVHGRVIAPMRDPDGTCLCSVVDEVQPGGSIDLYAKFSVAPGVDRVALELPTFSPFDGVVIARR